MKVSSRFILTVFIIAPLSVFITLFTGSMLFVLNSLFYIGLVLLLTGSMLIIIQEGFFNAFSRNTKKFFSVVSKKEQIIQDIEQRRGHTSSYQKKFPYAKPISLIGMAYTLFSVLGSVIYIYLGK